jgi:hypothetical protein
MKILMQQSLSFLSGTVGNLHLAHELQVVQQMGSVVICQTQICATQPQGQICNAFGVGGNFSGYTNK